MASRSLYVWNKLNCCPETYSKLFLEVDAVLLLLNLTFFVLPIFSAPAKRKRLKLYLFLESDIIQSYGVDTRSSCSIKRIRRPLPHFVEEWVLNALTFYLVPIR